MKLTSAVLSLSLVTLSVPASADSATYVYDSTRGRLVEIDYANGTKVVYTYDSAGNRTSETVTCSGGPC